MNVITENTPVAMMTVGQLASYLEGRPKGEIESRQQERKPDNKFIYGLRGIRQRYGVGLNTACSWANGILAPAVIREGRKIIVNTEKADTILEKWTQDNKRK